MKTFNAKFKKGGKGVFAISLVKTPATEETFIAMSAQEEMIKMAKVNEEQRIVMGLVLQPKQLILREDNGDLVTYPNNLILQKAVTLMQKDALDDSSIL